MNNLSTYIIEKILINKNTDIMFIPKTEDELDQYIKDKIKNIGNSCTKENPLDISFINFTELSKTINDISFHFFGNYINNNIKYVNASDWIFPDSSDEFHIDSLFEESPLEYINVSNWKLNKSIKSTLALFRDNHNLKEIYGLHTWDMKNIINIMSMFSECDKLEKIDVSGWDLSNVIKGRRLFNNCEKLKNIGDTKYFDFKNLKTGSHMFDNCISLTDIPGIDAWDMNSCVNISEMFNNCINLSINIDNWNINNSCNYFNTFNNAKKIKLPKWYTH